MPWLNRLCWAALPLAGLAGTVVSKRFEIASPKYAVWAVFFLGVVVLRGSAVWNVRALRYLLPLLPFCLGVILAQIMVPYSQIIALTHGVGFPALVGSMALLASEIRSVSQLATALRSFLAGLAATAVVLVVPYFLFGSLEPGGMYFNPTDFGLPYALLYDSNLNLPFFLGLLFAVGFACARGDLGHGNIRWLSWRSAIWIGLLAALVVLLVAANRRNVMLALALTLMAVLLRRWAWPMWLVPLLMPLVWGPVSAALVVGVEAIGADRILRRTASEDVITANNRDLVWNHTLDRLVHPFMGREYFHGDREELGNAMTEIRFGDESFWVVYHAHNTALEAFMSFGLVGWIGYLLSYGWLGKQTHVLMRRRWWSGEGGWVARVLVIGVVFCVMCGGAESLARLDSLEWVAWLGLWMLGSSAILVSAKSDHE
ncbi:MAG: O-antigen ligase family protein [Verrucomicrobiales bacterium]|nr:O-antigen ligase family protein [Verrucomicrobiales bacterium]